MSSAFRDILMNVPKVVDITRPVGGNIAKD